MSDFVASKIWKPGKCDSSKHKQNIKLKKKINKITDHRTPWLMSSIAREMISGNNIENKVEYIHQIQIIIYGDFKYL